MVNFREIKRSLGNLQNLFDMPKAKSLNVLTASTPSVSASGGVDLPVPPMQLDVEKSNSLVTPARNLFMGLDSGTTLEPLSGDPHSSSVELNTSPSSVWDGFRVYKPWGQRLTSLVDVRRAWESGDVVITNTDGNVPDFNTATSLFSSDVMPRILSLRKNEFSAMSNSPSRYFNKK